MIIVEGVIEENDLYSILILFNFNTPSLFIQWMGKSCTPCTRRVLEIVEIGIKISDPETCFLLLTSK